MAFWEPRRDRGLQVLAIADQAPDTLRNFRDQLGLTFPVLYDPEGAVYAHYSTEAAFWLASYPQDWIVGPGGTIVYLNNRYEPDEIEAVLDRVVP